MTGSAVLVSAVKLVAVAAAGFFAGRYLPKHRGGNQGVFVLAIQLQFENEADRDVFIDVFRPLASHVKKHEKDTLSYDLAIADTDPTKVLIHERYTSKEALTEVHNLSEPFLAFKQASGALPFSFTKTGQSYYEQGIGYM